MPLLKPQASSSPQYPLEDLRNTNVAVANEAGPTSVPGQAVESGRARADSAFEDAVFAAERTDLIGITLPLEARYEKLLRAFLAKLCLLQYHVVSGTLAARLGRVRYHDESPSGFGRIRVNVSSESGNSAQALNVELEWEKPLPSGHDQETLIAITQAIANIWPNTYVDFPRGYSAQRSMYCLDDENYPFPLELSFLPRVTWTFEDGIKDARASKPDWTKPRPGETAEKRIGRGQWLHFSMTPRGSPEGYIFCMPLQVFAFLSSYIGYWTASWDSELEWGDVPYLSSRAMLSYATPSRTLHPWCEIVGLYSFSLHYQAHYLTPVEKTWADAKVDKDGRVEPVFDGDGRQGLVLERHIGKIGEGDATTYFCERLFSVVAYVESPDVGEYNITSLSDEDLHVVDSMSRGRRINGHMNNVRDTWLRYGLKLPRDTSRYGKICGVTQFLTVVLSLFLETDQAWHQSLDKIDEAVRASLSDLLDDERRAVLMFDESFTRSKDYFVALQILRLVDEWVDKNVRALKSLEVEYRQQMKIVWEADAEEHPDLLKNWAMVIQAVELRGQLVKDRAAKKTEEIKSLRDGLFNATSLREATKAMALNRVIYIFTTMTVLYTPIGFLATFWALPFLNNENAEGKIPEPSGFRATLIIVPLFTYVIAAMFMWYFEPDRQHGWRVKMRAVSDGLGSWWRKLTNISLERPQKPPKAKDVEQAPGRA